MQRLGTAKYRRRLGSTKINRRYLGTTMLFGQDTLDTTAFFAEDLATGTSLSECTFNTDGSATLTGNANTSPASPRWWPTGSPPATWISYSSTGTGTITGGLTAGTRYQLNTARVLGNTFTGVGVRNRTFTISFYDAASGGNLLGTKTFTANTEAV